MEVDHFIEVLEYVFFRISLIGLVASHDDPGATDQSGVDREVFFDQTQNPGYS